MFPKAKQGKQNSLFPVGPGIKCFVIPSNSKLENTAKNIPANSHDLGVSLTPVEA